MMAHVSHHDCLHQCARGHEPQLPHMAWPTAAPPRCQAAAGNTRTRCNRRWQHRSMSSIQPSHQQTYHPGCTPRSVRFQPHLVHAQSNPPQVLEALADPGHPALRSALRATAAAITTAKHDDTHLWLQGGLMRGHRLVESLLRILRALPALPLTSAEAADTCAAAAAVLANTFCVARRHPEVLPGSDLIQTLVAQVANPDVMRAVVHFGMLGPAACVPLFPAVHVELAPGEDPSWHGGRLAWTPLRVCGHLLAALVVEDARCGGPGHMAKVRGEVGQLADSGVVRCLLEAALEGPCGEGRWSRGAC
jgi:hypothetical protein